MRRMFLVCVATLLLAACGDKDTQGGNPLADAMRGRAPSGLPAGLPGQGGSADPWKDMLSKGGTIRLTDEMMENYVALLKELKDVGTPGEALLARHHFDAPTWAGIGMVIATSHARATLSGARPRLETQLAELRTKRAAATDPSQQSVLDLQIRGLEQQLESMGGFGEANDVDRENVAVYERWKERLEAVTR